jgi:hypothetical protein
MTLPFDMPLGASTGQIAAAARKAYDIETGGDLDTIIANRAKEGAARRAAIDREIEGLDDLNSRLRGDLRRYGPLKGWDRLTREMREEARQAALANADQPDAARRPDTGPPDTGEDIGGPDE